jgi:membrane-bound metal-dependent hydrolase YbcI (DUF457 family)
MFIGHFGLAYAAKRLAPRASLGSLFLAAQWVDLLWPTLLLLGVERARVEPGATVLTPLRFEHYPWSHSLLMTLAWGLLLGLVYFAATRRSREALVVAALVPSHWLLDWLVHAPDLPLLPNGSALHGLGLWDVPMLAIPLEAVIFITGVALYLAATRPRDRAGQWSAWSLLLALVAIHASNMLSPPPPDMQAVAVVGQAQWLFVAWAWWSDRHRVAAGAA